jgi:uncharacterized protein YjdB
MEANPTTRVHSVTSTAHPQPHVPGHAVRLVGAWVILALAGWFSACTDGNPISPFEGERAAIPDSTLVSNSVSTNPVSLSSHSGYAAGAVRPSQVADDVGDVAYVSLPVGFVPDGITATISNQRTESRVVVTLLDGGFDPVAVPAATGDFLEIEVNVGASTRLFSVRVPARRPPRVVRTYPPPKKKDVALNASIIVVFSEPVEPSSVTGSSVRLLLGTTAVAGTVALLEDNPVAAAFTPATPLSPNTTYRLEVSTAVTDLEGDALESDVSIDFTTSQTSVGQAASIRIMPDSLLALVVGTSYQVTATVRDAAGNVLVNQPITWSTSDATGVAISQSGLVMALGDGVFQVTASAGSVRKTLAILVHARPPSSIVLAPAPAAVPRGDTVILTATVRDAAGRVINRPPLMWTSNDSAVADVAYLSSTSTQAGMVGKKEGVVAITATAGSVSERLMLTVGPPVPVASVTLASAVTVRGGTTQMTATLRDVTGREIGGRVVSWTTDNSSIATVDGMGIVTGVSVGSANVIGTVDGVSGSAKITVIAVNFVSISAGGPDDWNYGTEYGGHTCGLTVDGTAFCWGGRSTWGGATDDWVLHSSTPRAVAGDIRFVTVESGGYQVCGLTDEGMAYCWELGAPAPVAVGGPRFSTLTASKGDPPPWGGHVCGLGAGGAAYCWGGNAFGQLGFPPRGLQPIEWDPVPVSGGLTFSALSAGGYHTCGLTTAGVAYCWGDNTWGKLGNGTSGGWSSMPLPVVGGLTFVALAAGVHFSCGLTSAGGVYCWGGAGEDTPSPVPMEGFPPLAALTAGPYHICGLTKAGAAYCLPGPAGVPGPVEVPGGHVFASISAGSSHTCGITTTGVAYCWGKNNTGQLGDGSTSDREAPVKVVGQP